MTLDRNSLIHRSQQQAVTFLRILYPIWALVGMFSIMYVPSTLIVSGNTAATAVNIMANELLFRMGIVGSLTTQLIHVAVVLVLYRLFNPVSKTAASTLVILGLLSVPIAMLNTLNRIAALILLNGTDYLNSFGVDQLNALVTLFLELNTQGVFIATIFWGLWLFPLGYLIKKSGYFPKILGSLMYFAGFGYLLDAFTHFALTDYASYESILLPLVQLMTIWEVVFMVWVLFKGAKLPSEKSNK